MRGPEFLNLTGVRRTPYWDSGQDDRYGADDGWDPNGDDDGDGILNQDELIQVDGAKSEQIANWNDFSKSMTVWTEWYITLSTAVLGTEFAAFKCLTRKSAQAL